MDNIKKEFHSTTKAEKIRLANYLATVTKQNLEDEQKRHELSLRLNKFMSSIAKESEPYIQAHDCTYAIEQYDYNYITVSELFQRINAMQNMLLYPTKKMPMGLER